MGIKIRFTFFDSGLTSNAVLCEPVFRWSHGSLTLRGKWQNKDNKFHVLILINELVTISIPSFTLSVNYDKNVNSWKRHFPYKRYASESSRAWFLGNKDNFAFLSLWRHEFLIQFRRIPFSAIRRWICKSASHTPHHFLAASSSSSPPHIQIRSPIKCAVYHSCTRVDIVN